MASDLDYKEARALIPVNNLMGVEFLTRACPLECSYCNIIKSPLGRRPLTKGSDWIRIFSILDSMGVTFNLILGNEPLVLGKELVEFVSFMRGGTPYALYTTTPEPMWSKWKDALLRAGLHGISCGIDYPKSWWNRDVSDDIKYQIIKSKSSYESMLWVLDRGAKACQGTATITSKNLALLPEVAMDLTESGIWFACNPVHWDSEFKEGDNKRELDKFGYDFFPPKKYIQGVTLDNKKGEIEEAITGIRYARDVLGANVFNEDEQLDDFAEFCPNGNDWHCTKPNIMSVDPDGYMRVCGYRKGKRCNQISIFDFETAPIETTQKWLDAWYRDMLECPGCMWTMWNSAERHDEVGERDSIDYFGRHGNELLDESRWDNVGVGNRGSNDVLMSGEIQSVVKRVTKSGEWPSRKKEIQALVDEGLHLKGQPIKLFV